MNKAFLASLRELTSMLDFIQEQAESMGFEELQISKITLAAEEIVVNVISYGYPNAPKGKIEIECSPHPEGGINITFKDDGIPYNPIANAVTIKFTPDSEAEHRKIGGFGILVVLRMMDKVSYRHDNGWNVLTLQKFL